MADRPIHEVVGAYTPIVVKPHTRPGALDTLPDHTWEFLNAGTGNPSLPYRDPLTTPLAADALLPVAYGQVRVPGAMLVYSLDLEFSQFARGVVAWCEGEIASIDAVWANGKQWIPCLFTYWGSTYGIYFDQHVGAPGDNTTFPVWGAIIVNVALPASCAYTYWNVLTNVYYHPAWRYVPGAVQIGPSEGGLDTVPWAADVHGLRLYDPRLDSTNGGSGPQRTATPSTWTYSNNPVLIYRDLLRRFGYLTDAEIDDASIAIMAAAADAAGFTCNIVFSTKTLLRDAIVPVLQTCNGKEITSNGRQGLYLDIPNSGAPVASFSEEDGDIWDLKYEFISARDRYTRIAVAFANSAAEWKSDQTPYKDDPGIALGTVPIKPLVVNAPGISTLDAAVILRDYLFNLGTISYRISGTMNGRGITLQEGQKIHLTTLRGEDVDALLIQIPGDQQGFFSFAVKPYDSDAWGSAPVSQGAPIIPVAPPDPSNPPDLSALDIIVTDTAGTRQVMASSASNQTVYELFQLIKYTLPTGGPALKELHVRGFRGTGADTKSWDDMADSEVIAPLAGNEPKPDAGHFALSHTVVKTIRTLTFAGDGQLVRTVDATGPTRIMVKTATVADVLSTGVTIDVAASTDTTTNPRTDVPLWKWVKSSTTANGSTKVFAIPTKPVAGSLIVIADGQPLVDSAFSPVDGADYSLSALNVTIASGRPAPSSYVAFFYQESVE